MYLVYKPEGQPEQRWHYEPGRMRSPEMILIEKVTGMKYGQQFKQELMQGGTVARAALLWVHLLRDHPTVKFKDIEFYDDELQLVQDRDELADEIRALEDDEIEGLDPMSRAAGLALLRRQLAEAPEAPGKAPTATTAAPASGAVPSPASGGSDGSVASQQMLAWAPPVESAPTPPPASTPGPGAVAPALTPPVAVAVSPT